LSVEQVSYAHTANPAQAPLFTLEATSFQARPGEIVAILGPNASGKSTLLNLISGALSALSGRILLDGFVHALADAAHAPRSASPLSNRKARCSSRARLGIRPSRAAMPMGARCALHPKTMFLIAKNALAQVGAADLSGRWMDQFPAVKSSASFSPALWRNSRCSCCLMNPLSTSTSPRRSACWMLFGGSRPPTGHRHCGNARI